MYFDLCSAAAADWGVTRSDVKQALLAEDYATGPADIARVERNAVAFYRAARPVNRLPEAVNDGAEVLIIGTMKHALAELEAEHILEVEAEFCRKVGVL